LAATQKPCGCRGEEKSSLAPITVINKILWEDFKSQTVKVALE